MLQTSIELDELKDNYNMIDNIMVLPGNHDSHTIQSWYNNMTDENKSKLKEFLRMNNCPDEDINWGIIEYCFKSKSKIVMVTVQDILGLDDSARINIPGVDITKNWTWKLDSFDDLKREISKYKKIE